MSDSPSVSAPSTSSRRSRGKTPPDDAVQPAAKKRRSHHLRSRPAEEEEEEGITSADQPLTHMEVKEEEEKHPLTAFPGSSQETGPTSSSSSPLPPTSSPSPPSPPPPPPSSSRISLLRLQSDLKSLDSDPPEGISASPLDPSNLFLWRCCIFGPSNTPWEGGIFQLQLLFPSDYPLKPPAVKFITKIFHPNVFPSGELCLDIIKEAWSPIYSVASILTSIQSLLTDPNIGSPANTEAAALYKTDQKEYRRRVRACAAKATM